MSIVPGTNDAPGLFSTTNATPICVESCCVRMRIRTSTEPPGAEGTTKRTGFSGYAASAATAIAARSDAMSGPMRIGDPLLRLGDLLEREDVARVVERLVAGEALGLVHAG